MIAQYIDTPKLGINRKVSHLLSRKMAYNVIRTPETTEQHILVHSICSLLSREIADSLEWLSDKKLISKTGVQFFVDKANAEIDYLEEIYAKNNKKDVFIDDFNKAVGLCKKIAEKSVSKFQQERDPMLVEILTTIYAIKFIENSVRFISWCVGKYPEKNVLDKIGNKRKEVETLFLERYAEVSNTKGFDFNKFNNLFDNVKKMTHEEFGIFVNEL